MNKVALVNGKLVSDKEVFAADLLMEDGVITGIAESGSLKDYACEVVDCEGKFVLPGAIDVHVHFREPGHDYKEDWESASKSAVIGGVTTVLDMPNNNPAVLDAYSLASKRELISGRSYVNYGLYMGFDGSNLDFINDSNVPAVKFYACDSTGDMGVKTGVRELFEKCNKLIVVHSEDGDVISQNKKELMEGKDEKDLEASLHSEIRSVKAACDSTERLCKLALETNHCLHIAHLSTVDELDIIKKYRALGAKITCEVAPHHLFFSVDDYQRLGSKLRMNPPVRERRHVEGLWKGVEDGDVELIATDHAPHTLKEKGATFSKVPSGVPGVEFLLPLFLNEVSNKRLKLNDVVRLVATAPAEVFSIDSKGRIEEGMDADLVVVDMDLEKEISEEMIVSKCQWSPYLGMKLKGWPVKTFVKGTLVVDQTKLVADPNGEEWTF